MDTRKELIVDALSRWIRQRPGLEYGNYGNITTYRAEMRDITRDLHHARELLAFVCRHDSITADDLIHAAEHSYSGRLSIDVDSLNMPVGHAPRVTIDYCTGQYWPTEYRRAVCAVLASAVWDWYRVHCMPDPAPASAGDYIRRQCLREFGRSIANRWFR